MSIRFDTALREYPMRKMKEIGGAADLVIGIPSYNSEETIAHVVKTVSGGLRQDFPALKAFVMVSDGGSLDYTREVVQRTRIGGNVHKVVSIYRGLPGKGTALRAVFEAGVRLNAKACAVFDSDLRSITPKWVRLMLDPVLTHGYDFVSPYYVRHKYDASITNNVAYSLTRALYGLRVRQPIGGDFGFSAKMLRFFTEADVWDTDIAKFGIDIWLTTLAISQGMRICEVYLGSKVHDPKDPAVSLGPMFRQVVGTLFGMLPTYEHIWRKVQGSHPVPVFGAKLHVEPPPVEISLPKLEENFRTGFEHFGPVWEKILAPGVYRQVEKRFHATGMPLAFDAHLWVNVLYDFAATYLEWTKDKYKLVEMMTPLYYGRIAGFVHETMDMSTEQAEEVIEAQAGLFEQKKKDFIRRVDAGRKKK